jgi:hypothetical protein
MRPSEREIFRASRLDEFRRFLSGETFTGDEYTPEKFVSYLTERNETPKMAAGTAVHKVLELAGAGDLSMAEQNGWSISFDLNATLALPTMREVPLRRVHNGITLNGRVDSITATTVRDVKTTEQFDAEKYHDSYQWRAYLWMSGRSRFVYDVFKVKLNEDDMTVSVVDYAPMQFYRYAGMDKDVEWLVDEYAEAVRSLGILSMEAA